MKIRIQVTQNGVEFPYEVHAANQFAALSSAVKMSGNCYNPNLIKEKSGWLEYTDSDNTLYRATKMYG